MRAVLPFIPWHMTVDPIPNLNLPEPSDELRPMNVMIQSRLYYAPHDGHDLYG
jgi:hypothetical protein